MTTFDDIQELWNQQYGSEMRSSQPEELIILAEKNTRKIKVKQFWTIGILGVSILFFLWYLFIYVGFMVSWFHAGLSLMFFALLLRLIVEYRSYIRLQQIDIRSDLTNYSKGIAVFYHNRKRIHFMVTPIAISAYTVGFILLLPVFKKSFSTGFFLYIVVSGFSFLSLFVFLMTKQIKSEMKLLEFLKRVG